MNVDSVTEFFQKGFRVSLGATSFLVETIQDPNKRDENLQKLNSNFNSMDFTDLTEELAEKGEVTEQEARKFVDNILQQNQEGSSSYPTATADYPTSANPQTVSRADLQQQLQGLTEEIIALRTDLEKLRDSESQE